ncbi:MAG: hypothetical protein ACREKN_08060 [Longimicrobiaceae bacterium]
MCSPREKYGNPSPRYRQRGQTGTEAYGKSVDKSVKLSIGGASGEESSL